jgi:hypothetical protein
MIGYVAEMPGLNEESFSFELPAGISFLLMQALARTGGEKADLDFNFGRSRMKIAN